MFRFLPTILLRRRLIIVRLTMSNLRAFLERLVRKPRFLHDIIHRPKSAVSKAPNTIITLINGGVDIAATTSSIGLGNTLNDFADRLLPAQREIWVGKYYLQSPTRTIWEGHNGSSARQTGGCDKMPPGKTLVHIEGISSLPARRQ